MAETLAYLSHGKLHLRSLDAPDTAPSKEFDSQFGEQVRTRALQIHKRHEWKTSGRGARFQGGMSPAMWGGVEPDPAAVRVEVTGLSRGRSPGEILFSLATTMVGGVFALDPATGKETRLFHSSDERVSDLCAHPDQSLVACSVRSKTGTASLAVMRDDGSDLVTITEGDSIDLAPRWIPDAPRSLVFQSQGIGRDGAGTFVAIGPAHVVRLDVEGGALTTLLEEASTDFLAPRIDEQGTLWCIRRPRKAHDAPPLWRVMFDLLLLPFRLVGAIFAWLNFFTVRYTGKPLTNADGAKQKAADMRRMLIMGNLVDADAEARRGLADGDDAPSLVPKTWALIKLEKGSKVPKVVAEGVVAFDVAKDGAIIVSNGRAIERIDAKGKRTRLARGEEVLQIALVD